MMPSRVPTIASSVEAAIAASSLTDCILVGWKHLRGAESRARPGGPILSQWGGPGGGDAGGDWGGSAGADAPRRRRRRERGRDAGGGAGGGRVSGPDLPGGRRGAWTGPRDGVDGPGARS